MINDIFFYHLPRHLNSQRQECLPWNITGTRSLSLSHPFTLCAYDGKLESKVPGVIFRKSQVLQYTFTRTHARFLLYTQRRTIREFFDSKVKSALENHNNAPTISSSRIDWWVDPWNFLRLMWSQVRRNSRAPREIVIKFRNTLTSKPQDYLSSLTCQVTMINVMLISCTEIGIAEQNN